MSDLVEAMVCFNPCRVDCNFRKVPVPGKSNDFKKTVEDSLPDFPYHELSESPHSATTFFFAEQTAVECQGAADDQCLQHDSAHTFLPFRGLGCWRGPLQAPFDRSYARAVRAQQ